MRLPFSEHRHPPRAPQSQGSTPGPVQASGVPRAPDPFSVPVNNSGAPQDNSGAADDGSTDAAQADASAPPPHPEDDPDRTPRAKILSKKVLAEYDAVEVDSGEDELPIGADDEDEDAEPASTKGQEDCQCGHHRKEARRSSPGQASQAAEVCGDHRFGGQCFCQVDRHHTS